MNLHSLPRLAKRLPRLALTLAVLASSPRLAPAQVTLQPVASNLSSPVGIVNAGDGSGRLFFVEQTGTIRVFNGANVLATPFLDVHTLVIVGAERGLLGLAFHPDYENNGRFFIFYTAQPVGDINIAEYHATPSSNVADPDAVRTIQSIPHGYLNHNGGMLAFGPDGYLYASVGDGGGAPGDPEGDAQNLASLYGKILRFDVDGASLIPPSNPFANDGDPQTREEIWDYGLRNPWRFSFDRETGDLYIGDVGEECLEEIDRQGAGSSGGTNYGWNVLEGNACYEYTCNSAPSCGQANYKAPILTYPHDPDCAVAGGYVYRGTASPGLVGTYLYGDYCSGVIRGATQGAGGVWTATVLLDTDLGISSFGEDELGELYVSDVFGGGIYRIAGSNPVQTYIDDFEDGDASDWTDDAGSWSVVAGALTNTPARKARILAPSPPCSVCSIETTVTAATPGTDLVLLGWWRSGANHVEVILSEDRDKVLLRRISGGEVSSQRTADFVLDADQPVEVRAVYDGSQISVFLDDSPGPVVTLRARKLKPGTAGFAVKGSRREPAAGSMDAIEVR